MTTQVNYSTTNEYEMIEYPGMVKNTDKMLRTLGGITKVSQVSGEKCISMICPQWVL